FVIVADEDERLHFSDLLPGEKVGVQVGEFAGRGVAALPVKLGEIARGSVTVSDGVFADRNGTYKAGLFDNIFELSAVDGQAHQIVAAAFLHGEVDGIAVGRPASGTLSVINHRANFAAIAAVGVHHPNVRIFHGGFAVGESAQGASK